MSIIKNKNIIGVGNNDLETLKSEVILDLKRQLLDITFPIGSIYLNMGNDPSSQLGGTWELIATEDKALYISNTANKSISEELPNITGGGISMELSNGNGSWTGALRLTKQDPGRSPQWSGDSGWGTLYFDASKSNSVYKNNGKVKVDGITVCAWKRIS